MKLSPQKTRMLQALLDKPHTSRELMIATGCNNPADHVQHFRKNYGFHIQCKMIPFVNRDEKTISIGEYSILECEREKAQRLLKGAATPKSNVISNLPKTTNDEAKYNIITSSESNKKELAEELLHE